MLKIEKKELEKKMSEMGSFKGLSEIELVNLYSTDTGKEELLAIK